METKTKASKAPAAVEPAKTVTTPVIAAVRSDITIPATAKRGGRSLYNFDSLVEAGQSFAVTNKKFEQVKAAAMQYNRGHRNVQPDPVNPGKNVTTYSKKVEVHRMDPATDPDGADVRVFRTI